LWRLAALGLAILVLTALGAPAMARFGDNAFIALALASGLLTLAATRLAERIPDQRRALVVILMVGLALRLVLLPLEPILSDDIYRYVWDGRVVASGTNPYRYVPADPALARLRDPDIFPRINRADYAVTIYPPAAQFFFLLVTRLGESVLVMKLALVACEILTAATVVSLLRRLGRPVTRVAAYAWHPLAAWEIANNGHLDGLMTALVCGGVWLALAGRMRAGAAVLAIGALVKPFALLALPPFWRPRERPWLDLGTPLVVALVAAVLYAPFLSVGRGVLGFLGSGYLTEQRIDTGGQFWLLRVWRDAVGALPGDTLAYLGGSALILVALSLRASLGPRRDGAQVISDLTGIVLCFLFLLSPDYPWYFLLALPFVALTGSPAAWALTIGGFLLYDIRADDPQIPFAVRATVLNLAVLAAALWAYFANRRRPPKGETG
jgi:hypothetical protein